MPIAEIGSWKPAHRQHSHSPRDNCDPSALQTSADRAAFPCACPWCAGMMLLPGCGCGRDRLSGRTSSSSGPGSGEPCSCCCLGWGCCGGGEPALGLRGCGAAGCLRWPCCGSAPAGWTCFCGGAGGADVLAYWPWPLAGLGPDSGWGCCRFCCHACTSWHFPVCCLNYSAFCRISLLELPRSKGIADRRVLRRPLISSMDAEPFPGYFHLLGLSRAFELGRI